MSGYVMTIPRQIDASLPNSILDESEESNLTPRDTGVLQTVMEEGLTVFTFDGLKRHGLAPGEIIQNYRSFRRRGSLGEGGRGLQSHRKRKRDRSTRFKHSPATDPHRPVPSPSRCRSSADNLRFEGSMVRWTAMARI